jgi:hypothetical protein
VTGLQPDDIPVCASCGQELGPVGPGGRLMHPEPWCDSWTYHAAVGDALPVRWAADGGQS